MKKSKLPLDSVGYFQGCNIKVRSKTYLYLDYIYIYIQYFKKLKILKIELLLLL